ncbi:MAG: hypothetical protein HY582_03465 [Candidatus Omnitrophica bacterium]|nr:hypothetical protein [Candidatus Omnitrophota bacterium]
MKRFLQASIAVFITIGILEFVIHGYFLKDLYQETMSVWRPEVEMKSMMGLMWLGYLIFAPVFVFIYSKGYEAGKSKLAQGLRYGFWIGLLMNAMCSLVSYVVLPIPQALAISWFVAGMVESLAVGAVVGLTYQK